MNDARAIVGRAVILSIRSLYYNVERERRSSDLLRAVSTPTHSEAHLIFNMQFQVI